ncbi:AraC family transcriptional regulator [Nonomuraea roseoviolacea]|uniref:AraC-like DNA-binding protein n=1 Tax=Nonomuraea roseoviolacea subsp. carminata TaxID=160689 RepID=A0ABT1KBW5_9ACTN|nr:AraC family transcriptional regulator [Nonomuraea roseoviolacea]MCP2351493.1 AraC-like DNA-binding protein [Nonomuraea roseoviolacea subsp. carminata]
MDVLTDLLNRARAQNALVRRLIRRPPWGVTYADAPPLTVAATLGGHAAIRVAGGAPTRLAAGDIALITAPGGYTIADDPATSPEFVIRDGRKHLPTGAPAPVRPMPAPRTYGGGADMSPNGADVEEIGMPGVTVMLRGAYELHGDVAARLLGLLPPLAVVPAGPRTRTALDLLSAEAARDEPGQDAVLARLLDLVLVIALRAWCTRPEATPPAWYRALGDPAIGEALRLLHEDPAHRWTVAALAAKVGMSRAAFARRFADLVGRPPLGYLTDWRMTLAADLLRDGRHSVAAVARRVGYQDPFAFSVAFRRARGHTPSAWRDPGPDTRRGPALETPGGPEPEAAQDAVRGHGRGE